MHFLSGNPPRSSRVIEVLSLSFIVACSAVEVSPTKDALPDASPRCIRRRALGRGSLVDAPAPRCRPDPSEPVTVEKTLGCNTTASYTAIEEVTRLVVHEACSGAPASVEGLPDGRVRRRCWLRRGRPARSGRPVLLHVCSRWRRAEHRGGYGAQSVRRAERPVTTPASYVAEHGLPVFHLTWHSDVSTYCKDAVDRDSVPADITVDGTSFVGAELRCRGATSLTFPKKSFSLDSRKTLPFMRHRRSAPSRVEGAWS